MDVPRTDFLYSPVRARLALALFCLTAAFFIAVSMSPLARGFASGPDRGPGDVQLYRAEADRIRSGANYYDAAATELTARRYPTQSVFNWRTPLPVWLFGVLPEQTMGNVLLGVLGLTLLLISFHLLAEEGSLHQAGLGAVLLAGALFPCFLGDVILLSEIWSGVLVALSAVLFGVERRKLGIAAGIAALVVRELAAPYAVVCLAIAATDRRYRELAWWLVGLALYAGFYAWHLSHVLPRITPEAIAHQQGWVRFGGAGFLIATAQMNAFLLLLPQWATGVYLACALLGAAGWNSPAGRRIGLTVAAYCAAFAIAGQDFNQYWGCQIAPLLCLAVGKSAGVLRQLCDAAGWVRHAPSPLAPG